MIYVGGHIHSGGGDDAYLGSSSTAFLAGAGGILPSGPFTSSAGIFSRCCGRHSSTDINWLAVEDENATSLAVVFFESDRFSWRAVLDITKQAKLEWVDT